MSFFPYGKAALSIFLLALVSGAWILLHPVKANHATLTYWTFSPEHYKTISEAIPGFEKTHPGVTIDLQQVSNNAYASRLQAAFLADLDVPDICELEIGTAGTMFRGPLKDIGFTDLTPRLQQTGLINRMVTSRFAPYTSRGHIFGMPQDVHPVQIAYRRDIFEKYGIDASKIKTWDDFIAAGHKITIPGKQYMIELSDSDVYGGGLETMLLQRGGGYFDKYGNCIIDNDIAVQTMKWYCSLVGGPHKIGFTVGDQYGALFTKAIEDGYEVCVLCPDWRTKLIEDNIGRVSGKMAVMPLPAVTPGGIRTSTWGGTMLGITKHCKKQDLAWEFAQYLYTDPSHLQEGFLQSNIIPPLKAAWNMPVFKEKRPFWSNQPIGALYAKLAPDVPPQYTSPVIDTAKGKLGESLIACVKYYNEHGDDAGFEPFIRASLKSSAGKVRAIMRRNPY